MNWLVWKQHRKLFITLVVILALYAGLAIPMGANVWHTYQHALATCSKTDTCNQLSNNLFKTGWSAIINANSGNGAGFLLIVPFLLGMFVGVPLITREYDAGTNLLVWTRSISRRKWLTTKLVWILIATALFAGVFAALTTWWSKAGNALYVNRFSGTEFNVQGVALVGYAVLAVSIGIALGTWLKRTMVAIGLTLVLMLATQIVIGNFVRPHYMTPRTTKVWTNQLGPNVDSSQTPSGASITSYKIVNKQGQTLSWTNPPTKCVIPQSELPKAPLSGGGHHTSTGVMPGENGPITSVNGGPAVGGTCLESAGYHYVISYQPSYRYWDFQRIELSLYLALSVIPIGATYWLVLKRDA